MAENRIEQFNDPIDHNKTDVQKRPPKVESDNAMFELTSGTCLEHRQLVKTTEKKTCGLTRSEH